MMIAGLLSLKGADAQSFHHSFKFASLICIELKECSWLMLNFNFWGKWGSATVSHIYDRHIRSCWEDLYFGLIFHEG